MIRQLGSGAAEVSSDELGANCWHPRRFVEVGSRCDRIMTCQYPEKAECKAVETEIQFLSGRIIEVQHDAIKRMQQLGQSIIELQKATKKSDENACSRD